MKKEATNTFSEGMILDLNPIMTPNNVLSNALNATLITMNGNEYVLQNDMGNGRVETATLPTGFVPIGVKEYGGIIYVASYNPITGEGQLGSFPSPETNLTQDEISDQTFSISKSDFLENGEIKYYYKRIEIMPSDMYINPGDKFGLFITATDSSAYDLLSYYNDAKPRLITFHPAIVDDLGMINYIDDECKEDGKYTQGLIFGQSVGDLSTVDGYREAFEKLIVYSGKKSGKLVLIVELETLEDFSVSRSVSSSKLTQNAVGSSLVAYSDDSGGEDVTFRVTFYNSGWPDSDNETIQFVGVRFESDLSGTTYISATDIPISYYLDGFTRDQILTYTITPYTQLGPCTALARTGIINFALFGTGNIIFTEWRYYVENNKLKINYGFDLNLLEGESVKSLTFQFYDVYYDVLYDNIYTCGSTINGTYSGNYTETFNLPYDLNYADTYYTGLDNDQYIAAAVLGIENVDGITNRGNILKTNELLKNNFYCVKITLITTGLENGDSEKVFYRFLYTTGVFNQAYVEGIETNFSVLQVPESHMPTYSLYCDYNTNSNSEFNLNYLNNPTINGDETPYRLHVNRPDDTTNIETNMYQDWILQNATVSIKTSISVPTTSNLFGKFQDGWIDINIENPTITITYNNDTESMSSANVINTEAQNYVSLLNGDNNDQLYTYEEMQALTGLEASPDSLFGYTYSNELYETFLSDADSTKYAEQQAALIEANDLQFYSIDGDVSTDTDSDGNTVINIGTIRGRLIRRLSGGTNITYETVSIDELRPCIYVGMDSNELQALIGGCVPTEDSSIIDTSDGKVLGLGGDKYGKADVFASWNTQATLFNADSSEVIANTKGDSLAKNGLDYRTVIDTLTGRTGNCCMYIVQNNVPEIAYENNQERLGYLGFGVHTYYSVGNSRYPFGGNFIARHTDCRMKNYFLKSIWDIENSTYPSDIHTTLVTWRTTKSTSMEADYGFINLAGESYSELCTYSLIPLLQKMHVLHEDVSRTLYVEKISNYVYHDVFATTVNIGIEIPITETANSTISTTRSPILLYDGTPFDEENVAARITTTCGWDITEDKWYKDVYSVDLTSNPQYLQCSYLNIPYAKIMEVTEYNEAVRAGSAGYEDSYVTDFDLSNITQTENGYLLGITMSLGSQINMAEVYTDFQSASINNSDTSFIYTPNDDGTFELEAGTDIVGNSFTTAQVYYKTDSGFIGGNTDEVEQVQIFIDSTEQCSLKRVFIPKEVDGYMFPLLNTSAISGTVLEVNTPLHDSDYKDCTCSGFYLYGGVYFDHFTRDFTYNYTDYRKNQRTLISPTETSTSRG